jgi:hypothetical protein
MPLQERTRRNTSLSVLWEQELTPRVSQAVPAAEKQRASFRRATGASAARGGVRQ